MDLGWLETRLEKASDVEAVLREATDTICKAFKADRLTIYRASDDPNTIVIVNDFATVEGARAFSTDPSLKDVMARAGVDSAPQVWICEEAESERY